MSSTLSCHMILWLYLAAITTSCGDSSSSLGIQTSNTQDANTDDNIYAKIAYHVGDDEYMTAYRHLENNGCDDFKQGEWDWFNNFDDIRSHPWDAIYIKNDGDDGLCITSIKYIWQDLTNQTSSTFNSSGAGSDCFMGDDFWVDGDGNCHGVAVKLCSIAYGQVFKDSSHNLNVGRCYTPAPTLVPTSYYTEYLSTHAAESGEGNVEKYFIFIIIGGSTLLCSALVCVICCIYLQNRKTNKRNTENVELVKAETTNPKIIKKESAVPGINIYSDDSALQMWLNSLGLNEYYSLFAEQGFNSNVSMLYELKDENLKEIGIKKMADRLLIIKALNEHRKNAQVVEIQGNDNFDAESGHLYDEHNGPRNNIQGENVNSEEEWEYFEDGKRDNNKGTQNMHNNSDSEKMYKTTAGVTTTYGSDV